MAAQRKKTAIMTLREAASAAGLSYEAMRLHLVNGRLRYSVDQAGHYRIRREDFEEWVKKPRKPGRPVKYYKPAE